MSEHSKIEWCDATWPVVAGCTKVSAGCDNCYAIRDSRRLGGNPNHKVLAAYGGTTAMKNGRLNWAGVVRPLPERLDWPLKWKKPRRIFVCNESDLFHEAVPIRFIAEVFNTMASFRLRCRKKECEHDDPGCFDDTKHIYQILTKRPARMLSILQPDGELLRDVFENWPGDSPLAMAMESGEWPLSNVWPGVSVEDQRTANERILLLLQTPAAVRFVSYEPALGPVDFTRLSVGRRATIDSLRGGTLFTENAAYDYSKVDWIIAGGESGPGARPSHPHWFRQVRDQCQEAGIAYFFKQWGEWIPTDRSYFPNGIVGRRGFTHSDGQLMWRIGKKNAGRLLDGKEWNEVPEVLNVKRKEQ